MSGGLEGRRCVVTGASGGIGEAIASILAAKGAELVLIARDRSRLEAARTRLCAAVPGTRVELFPTDLSLQAEVRNTASLVGAERVDVLVLNAATIPAAREETAEGIETTLAVNHLAPFLLANLLKPRLANDGRVVVVSADPYWSAREPVDLDDLAYVEGFSPARAYMRTKNMNAMFAYAFARRLEGTGTTVNAAHPGVIATSLGRNMGGLMGRAFAAARPFLPSAERGADTPAWLAWSPELTDVSGRFFVKRKERTTAPHTRDVARQDALWRASETLTGLGT